MLRSVLIPCLLVLASCAKERPSEVDTTLPDQAKVGTASESIPTPVAAPAASAQAIGASLTPLNQYDGKYPWDRVEGRTFLRHPTVIKAVEAAVPDPSIRKNVLSEKVVTGGIKVDGNMVRLNACEQHNCPHNWMIGIDTRTGKALVCYQESTGSDATWFSVSRPPEVRPGGCGW